MRSLLFLLISIAPLRGVVLFQLETFDSATGWAAGGPHPSPPSIQADTGPLGTGDSSLRISASPTAGAGSRLASFNTSDWAGDYLGAGITSMTMDLRNQSPNPSVIRVAINGPGGWFATAGQSLGVFSIWTPVEFDLTPSGLQSAGGNDASATLAAVTEIRILHSDSPAFRGGTGQRTLLVDNIQAVPEPASSLLVAVGMVFLIRRKRQPALTRSFQKAP